MKRHIALLLAVVMCISFLPANFAAAADVTTDETVRTIYTDEMIENARNNIAEFSWAREQMDDTVALADIYLAKGADFFWTHVPSQWLPRAYHLGMEGAGSDTKLFDPDRYTCRDCGKDLYDLPDGGNYPWSVNPISKPWKITCPACGESFPSNDFGKFYELGIKNSPEGKFKRENALEAHREMLIEQGLLPVAAEDLAAPGDEYTETWYQYYGYGVEGGYLHNDLHADKNDPRWGVDDGWGYVTNGEPPVGDAVVERVVPYIALYNHFANFQSGSNNLVTVVNTLGTAYMYTGDEKYGILGAIILDRFADNYPDYDLSQIAKNEDGSTNETYIERYKNYPNNNGGSNAGKAIGRIWECFVAEALAEAYDKLKPAFDEPEVIDFLSEKAIYYGVEGDKSSGDAIRANIEKGILEEIYEGVKTSQIYGNFGLHQKAIISAAIALDDPELTPEMIDWVYASRKDGDNAHSKNSGGEINSMLIDGLYRDGQNLESPSYNEMGLSDLVDGAVALQRYAQNGNDIGNNVSILTHPKYVALMNSFLPITIGRKGVPGLADAGTAASYTTWPTTSPLLSAFQVLKDAKNREYPGIEAEVAKIAQQLESRIGKTSHYDIWTANPETLYDDVMALVEDYEYDYDKSTIMTGYGYAVLRSGTLLDKKNANGIIDTQRSFMLNFSGHYKHNHGDFLDLLIEAYGIGMTTDLGYPETPVAGDPHSNQFSQTAFSHNTVVVDNTNHASTNRTGSVAGLPQKPLHFDATSEKVQVIDAETPSAYDNADLRRTVVMVDFDDEVSYGVDFFNVKGGSDHLYTFAPNSNTLDDSEDPTVEGLTLVEKDAKTYAGAMFGATDVEFGGLKAADVVSYNKAYTWMKNVRQATDVKSGFSLDYEIKDFKGLAKNKDLDVNLRVTMLNDADEVSLVTTRPQKTDSNMQHIGEIERFLVRKKGTDLNSLFTAVYEPYKRDNRYIANISEVSNADGAKVVKVEFVEDRIDYIVYSEDKVNTVIEDGAISFPFQGFVGVYSVTKDGQTVLYSYVNDGTKIGTVEGVAEVTGTVVGYQEGLSFENYIDVEINEDVDVADLEGRLFVQENAAAGNASYEIVSAEKQLDGTIRLNLGNISTIDKFANEAAGTYSYIPVKNAAFTIPMSYEQNIGVHKVSILKDGAETSEVVAFVGDDSFDLEAKLTPAVESAVVWSSDNEAAATVDADGKVTIVGVGVANIKATAAIGGRSASIKINVLSTDNQFAKAQTYVMTTKAFNTSNMKTLDKDNYAGKPVLRLENFGIYFKDILTNWEYEIQEEWALDGVAFKAMNVGENGTPAPWELVANGQTLGSIHVIDSTGMTQEFTTERYRSGANYVVLRLKVENSGEYILKATGGTGSTAAAPATYFFKDEGDMYYTSAARYPEGSKLEYYDLSKKSENVLGRVKVDFPGDYILAFIADEHSIELNSKAAISGDKKRSDVQTFSLTKVELIPTSEDKISSLSVKADKSYLVEGEELPLDIALVWDIFGEDEFKVEDVEFTSSDDDIATVENGVVIAKKEGKVEITAKAKNNEDLAPQTLNFTVVSVKNPYKQEFITHLGSFKYSTLKRYNAGAAEPEYGTGTAYMNYPVMRENGDSDIFYYKPVLNWWSSIDAKYTTDNTKIKQFFDEEKSRPWAVEDHRVTEGGLAVYDGKMVHEAKTSYFANNSNDAPRLAIRLFVDAPGEYILKVKAHSGAKTPVPAVYFFEDGAATSNASPKTYPAGSKVGYVDFKTGASDYRVVGTVKADKVGEYIVSFICDANSAKQNTATGVQTLNLVGIMLDPAEQGGTLSYNFTSDAFNYEQMRGVKGIVSKVTDDYYYRDLVLEGHPISLSSVMFMNEALANPDLEIPAGYYGLGKPEKAFKVMNLEKTAPWAFAGANAVDVETSPIFQLRGSREAGGEGLHPYFDMDKYTDTAETQFYALSLDIPAAGEYAVTVDAKRAANAIAAPAVYFFKDTGAALTSASFINLSSTTKLGYIDSANTSAPNNEYLGTVNVPEKGKYIIAFVMDSTSKTLAQKGTEAHGMKAAQYLALYGVDFTPLYRGELTGISFKNASASLAVGEEKAIELIGQYGEKNAEIVDFEGFDFDVDGDAVVVENGVIKAQAAGTATITATYGDFTATATVNVFDATAQTTLKYVTTLSAFVELIKGATSAANAEKEKLPYYDYNKYPVLRGGVNLFMKAVMDWNYTHTPVDEADPYYGREPFNTMDLSKTAPWKLIDAKGNQGSYYINSAAAYMNAQTATYGGTRTPYSAYLLKIDAAGDYFVQINTVARGDGAYPAVYFYKDGTAGVTNTSAATYPESAKLGYVDMSVAAEKVMGKVTVAEPGNYVVAFALDAESKKHVTDKNVSYEGKDANRVQLQHFNLSGITLIPAGEDKVTGVNILASVPEVHVGESSELSIEEIWKYSGAQKGLLGDYTFTTDSANISIDGNVVTGLAVSENPSIITAEHKSDATKTATIAIKVVPYAEELEYNLALNALHKENMILGANSKAQATEDPFYPYYGDGPYIRDNGSGIFYKTAYMHWDAVMEAKYSKTGEEFKVMNLEKTAPWAYETTNVYKGSPALYSSNMQFEMANNVHTSTTPSLIAFRVKIDAPGTYKLQAMAARASNAPVPAVYFFKANDGVNYQNASAYAEANKVGYYDIPKAAGTSVYTELGTVNAEVSGEYIVAFVMDATSEEMNKDNYTEYQPRTNGPVYHIQVLNLSGIKLIPQTGMAPEVPDAPVDEDITAIALSVGKTELLEEETTDITVKATTESGKTVVLDPSEVKFSVDPNSAARVSSAGVVKALREPESNKAIITASLKEHPEITATIEINVFVERAQRVYEYVTTLAAFNDELMITKTTDDYTEDGKDRLYSVEPYLRKDVGIFYKPMMHWDYEVPAKYHNAENEADKVAFMAMDTDAYDGNAKLTDKWAYESATGYQGPFYVAGSAAIINARTANFGVDGSIPYMALRLNVDAAGEYFLNLKSTKYNQAIASAVYFFKAGSANVNYRTLATYPEGSYIGRFEMAKSDEYVNMGKVNVATPGDYIIVFAADKESLDYNSNCLTEENVKLQEFRLAGIKLIPTEDDAISSIEVSSDKSELTVGATAQLSLKEFWTVSGEKAPVLDNKKFVGYSFSSSDDKIATVDSEGKVTAVAYSENPVTIKVLHKASGVKDTVVIKFAPDQTELEYVTTLGAFNIDTIAYGGNYDNAPLFREGLSYRYYRYYPSMHWDYVVDGKHTTDGQPIDPFMNFEKTAPWAFEDFKQYLGKTVLLDSAMQLEMVSDRYEGGPTSFLALRVKVPAPGEYFLQTKATRDAKAPVPAVYFFKAEGVNTSVPKLYPAEGKVGHYDIPNAAGTSVYTSIGKVSVPESGEYIVAFVMDETSAKMNPNANTTTSGTQTYEKQIINLSGIKLTPAAENVLVGFEPKLSKADFFDLFVGETDTVSVEEELSVTGKQTAAVSDYYYLTDNTKVVTVGKTKGDVKAVGVGEATITVGHNATGAQAKFKVTVCPEPETLEYVTKISAFNHATLLSFNNTDTSFDGVKAPYNRYPVKRTTDMFVYTPAMNWWTSIDAKYTEDKVAIEQFMNFDVTDKWAFEAQSTDSYRITTNGYLAELHKAYNFLALKLHVPAPGKYLLQLKGGKATSNQPSPVMGAYLFKEGAANASNVSTWSNYKVANFDSVVAEYTTIGEVELTTSGDYIIGLLPDGWTVRADLLLSGIKLVHADDNAVTEFNASVDTTKLVIGETANITVDSAAREHTGAFEVDLADVEFTSSNAAVATVANGVVTAVGAGTAKITAKLEDKEVSFDFTVADFANAVDHEYVLTIASFDTDKMAKNTDKNPTKYEYTKYAVLRSGCLYYTPAMSWKYVQEKIDSEPTYTVTNKDGTVTTTYDVPYTDLETPFNTMKLDATDKWAFESYTYEGNPSVRGGGIFHQATKSSKFNKSLYVAYRVYVEQPGEYNLSAMGSSLDSKDDVKDAAVYFFKADSVKVGAPASYPADAKVGYYSLDGTDDLIGTVKVYEAGEYIISFATDDKTLESSNITTAMFEFSINNIKLTAVLPEPEPEMTGIELGLFDADSEDLPRVDAEFEIGEYALLWPLEVWSDGRDNAELFVESFDWSVDKEGIVEINEDSILTAIAAGEATITATCNGFTDSITVKVNAAAEPEPVDELVSIALTATPAAVEVEDEIALAVKATYSLTGEKDITEGVTYTVAPEGAVTFNGNVATAEVAGEATITATYEGKTATATVVIEPKTIPVEGVELDKTALEMTEGDKATLVATVIPSDATEDKTVTWISSNPLVAEVDQNGNVTALTAGNANITAKIGEFTATCAVTVNKKPVPVTGIELDKTSTAVRAGETVALVATVIPPETTMDKAVTWKSSNEAIAKVDANTGVITGVKKGTATITATLVADPSIKATATVKVCPVYEYKYSVQIGLIEPWFLKANARICELGTASNSNAHIAYENLADYGAYFIRASRLPNPNVTQDDLTWEDIVNDPDAVKYSKATGAYIDGKFISADYNEGLYTYEMSDSIFVVFYVEDEAGIVYTNVRERNMKTLLDQRKVDALNFGEEERGVYSAMSQLETDIIAYRGQFTNPPKLSPQKAPTLAEVLAKDENAFTADETQTYSDGASVQIILIEPWGLQLNSRVYTSSTPTGGCINYNSVEEYGAIVYYDTEGKIDPNVGMTVEELRTCKDAYVFSSKNGDAEINPENTKQIKILYNKGIYTYMLNSNAYVMFYIKDADGYHYCRVRARNTYVLANDRKADETNFPDPLERTVYSSMAAMYDAIMEYREWYFTLHPEAKP